MTTPHHGPGYQPIELPAPRDLIDGNWSEPGDTRSESIEDPNTATVVQRQRATTATGIETALAAAERAQAAWQDLGPQGRAEALVAMADHIEPRTADVAAWESATSGAVISITSMLGFITHAAFRLAAAQIEGGVLSARFDGPAGSPVEVERFGWGPALCLVPWNAPAPMAAHKVASALAAGCTVIVKPPERAPHGTSVIADAAQAAGLPRGVVQLVHGGPEVGGVLVNDDRIRAVSFTGGTDGGRAIATACAQGLKPAQLELGGHSPLLAMPDADRAQVAEAVVGLLTTLNGQWCRALGRLLLPAERQEELLEAILSALAQVRLGASLDPGSQMGPIVHSSHLALLQARLDQLADRGGEVLTSTALPTDPALASGNWLAPTLITGVDPSHTGTEIFGPVASVHPYRDLDHAIALANGTEYGLEAYVVGPDPVAALAVGRRLRAGGIKINGVSPMGLHLMAPRPAWGISGLMDEGTTETIQFFGGNRVLGIEGSLGLGA